MQTVAKKNGLGLQHNVQSDGTTGAKNYHQGKRTRGTPHRKESKGPSRKAGGGGVSTGNGKVHDRLTTAWPRKEGTTKKCPIREEGPINGKFQKTRPGEKGTRGDEIPKEKPTKQARKGNTKRTDVPGPKRRSHTSADRANRWEFGLQGRECSKWKT